MKITFISTGLGSGGAELMLYRLVEGLLDKDCECSVISLTEEGIVGEKLWTLGVQVQALNLRRSFPSPAALFNLVRTLKKEAPDLIQTWMYHADLFGGIASYIFHRKPLVWGVRQSNLDPRHSPWTTRLAAKSCARLSYFVPQKIVCCSHSAIKVHSDMGYDESKMLVIENGFDTDVWRASEQARMEVRKELGLSDDAFIIGLAARFDPQKDHENFFHAARRLKNTHPNVHFLLCGHGIVHRNHELMSLMEHSGLNTNVHLLGERGDMPRITAALDIATMSSRYGEGFPNVIGEAMACGVCCVATDVGDAQRIIGDTGWLVPKRDPDALADAWRQAIAAGTEKRKRMGSAASVRISERFSLERSVSAYKDLYHDLIA